MLHLFNPCIAVEWLINSNNYLGFLKTWDQSCRCHMSIVTALTNSTNTWSLSHTGPTCGPVFDRLHWDQTAGAAWAALIQSLTEDDHIGSSCWRFHQAALFSVSSAWLITDDATTQPLNSLPGLKEDKVRAEMLNLSLYIWILGCFYKQQWARWWRAVVFL